MTANELIGLIPRHVFSKLSAETKVDYQVKKLRGEIMFKLILFSIVNTNRVSLRVMESMMQSVQFKAFCNHDQHIPDSRYNSIRDRICTIQADYFEKLFKDIFSIYNKELKEEKALSKADSTYVTLSAKLLATGMQNGKEKAKRHVKYSVIMKGSLPATVKVFTEASYISESVALASLINEADYLCGDIVVFDRGIQTRGAFDRFSREGKLFIGRSKTGIRYKEERRNALSNKPKDATVTIISDSQGRLYSETHKPTEYECRIIRGIIDESGEEICLVTNITGEEAYLIAGWYKQRWQIEVFFKFIKQHLNASHLVSRTENGMKVMIYMTMITAILLLAYKKINKLKGYKIAKLKFETELETDIIKTIVLLCGGDPNKASHLFSTG